MIHPDTYVKQTHKGLGVFAGRDFKRGEILWIADDIDVLIPVKEYLEMDPFTRKKLDKYSYLNSDKNAVIAWDEGKYVNHSCQPNSTGILQFDDISVALKDIKKDEEIVEDYYSYYGHFETFECHCGASNCRGVIREDNTYSPSLRLDLKDVIEALMEHRSVLLDVKSKYQKRILAQIEEYFQKKRA